MFDLDDLHAAYRTLRSQAPTDTIELGGAHHAAPNRRRIVLPVLVAAAVAVTVTGTVALANSRSSSDRKTSAASAVTNSSAAANPAAPSNSGAPSSAGAPARAASFVTTYPFSVGALPDGLNAYDSTTSAQGDMMGIESTQGEEGGFIEVFPADAPQPLPANAVTVKIGSQTGYYGQIGASSTPSTAAPGSATDPGNPGVVWQDASGLWASVTGLGVATNTTSDSHHADPGGGLLALTQAQLVEIAEATHIGTPHTAKVPFKLTSMPAGYHVDAISADFGPSLQGGFPGFASFSPSSGTGSDLIVGVGTGHDQTPDSNTNKVTIGDFSGSYSPSYSTVTLTNSKGVSINVSRADMSGVSMTELTQIVSGLTLASTPSDPSTWFDATTALP